MRNTPALVTLLTAAVAATINLAAFYFSWDNALTASINLAAAAWLAVLGWFINGNTLTGPQLDYMAAHEDNG